MLPIFTTQAPPPDDRDAPDATDAKDSSPGGASGDSGASSASGRGSAKVELDLDGAPFLEAEPEEEEAPPPPSGDKEPKAVEAPPKKSRKKLLIIAAIGLVLVAGGGAGAFFMLAGDEGDEPADDTEVIVVPSNPQLAPEVDASKYNFAWPSFWVEVLDPEGEVRFVVCKLHVATDDPLTASELRGKSLMIRDAVYYYLSHKPYSFLADSGKLDAIKSDITNIINEYIYAEKKVEEVLLLDYLIK